MQHPITEEQRAYLAGRRVVASISGGKDSAALSLWLTENSIEHDRVFCDTGWEHEQTYHYLRGPLENRLGPITWLRAARDMEALILKKGMFPSKRRRFCTEELKVKPLQRYFSERLDRGEDCANAYGIRAEESKKRAAMAEWEWSNGFDVETWRPLLRWSFEDVVAIHKRHDLSPNPLYLRGASRVGCWPCIYARKGEIRFIAEQDPGRIDRLRELERLVGDAAEVRAAARGESLPNRPSWFQAPLGDSGACWPIDKVVQWSRTSRGGKQYEVELFAAPADDAGCMRWGLCETEAP